MITKYVNRQNSGLSIRCPFTTPPLSSTDSFVLRHPSPLINPPIQFDQSSTFLPLPPYHVVFLFWHRTFVFSESEGHKSKIPLIIRSPPPPQHELVVLAFAGDDTVCGPREARQRPRHFLAATEEKMQTFLTSKTRSSEIRAAGG